MKLDARSCQPVSAFLLTAAISGICRAQGDKGDVLDLVDPLIGTTNAGLYVCSHVVFVHMRVLTDAAMDV